MRSAQTSAFALLVLIASARTASLTTPVVHAGFGAVLRSRSLEHFEPSVLEDGEGMHRIADLPRTGLDTVLRVAAKHIGLIEAFEGKCLVLPAGVPEELKHDNVIRFDDALTGCEVSVWWRPLFSDAEHHEQKGLVIDGIFSRRSFKWEAGLEHTGELPWTPLIAEAKTFAKNAASPFAWWRATQKGTSVTSLESSSVSNLIADVEAAFKEAIQQ
mmetsp:Transcript_69438/g.101765  ORF Transcript_69438/g.101765 Transcript_69438/m.101765 type:complete len:215 (+) Transcript_69438:142-786(+)|eukprot:CAMPEP_0179435154 /NCGR_PEP_ID=MMETSP0799-20121207/19323_1 /TAXON_ID=46947 /ORGANISM="Geminigera cryophila, Strain CCMP2564" /LENGTH=214 /DNA_ID=CAMNT_0021214359 /DNA_START=137 /DNA_END=781 /DNA_ORIENTATION=+